MRLGCIADDFTGATDVANNLVRAGMRVVQTIGVPQDSSPIDADAVVVALKSRTTPASQAQEESVQACKWLLGMSRSDQPPQIYFKYCSTFDSTAQGNIGPVTEALMEALGTTFTIATPAFPDNGRSVFKGHLFVGDDLLSESSMRHHPLTPMTDANLVRVLQAQCRQRVGLVDHRYLRQGAETVRQRFAELSQEGVGVAIVDAIDNQDLLTLGAATADMPLVTAGSGLAMGLPAQWGFAPNEQAQRLPRAGGGKAILAGSCSAATQRQTRHFIDAGGAALALDPLQLAQADDPVRDVLAWAQPRLAKGKCVMVYSTANAEAVKSVQARLGTQQAGELVERTLAAVAEGLAALGVRQLIVAGGETSGACVQALSIDRMQIGPQIDPGVPWCYAHSPAASGEGMHLTLKSGNFGSDDFFTKAFEILKDGAPA
ncbi:3-oxo-tetronate kinase [Parapusillimonas sp. JC17]|uniref:3-oxo-tetronate kinase n=1 Tax=Parapusillimonas sp. JC17 TaxID=3445768 RepID=UPI003FA070F2